MATLITSNPFLLAPGVTTPVKYEAKRMFIGIEVTSGTFRINAMGEINTQTPSIASGTKVWFECEEGFWVAAASSSDTAIISMESLA